MSQAQSESRRPSEATKSTPCKPDTASPATVSTHTRQRTAEEAGVDTGTPATGNQLVQNDTATSNDESNVITVIEENGAVEVCDFREELPPEARD